MKISNVEVLTNWNGVFNSARTTINKEKSVKEPSSSWKKRILLAEHSPIRQLMIRWKWVDLPYYVSVHFVRHKIGIEHYVSTQRTDRTGTDRTKKYQDASVSHECIANTQAIITMSRKRLCNQASKETIHAWQLLLDELKVKEPELFSCCVPECTYRGFCVEFKCCGYVKTKQFKDNIKQYRDINNV